MIFYKRIHIKNCEEKMHRMTWYIDTCRITAMGIHRFIFVFSLGFNCSCDQRNHV
jgi:hypothetical protein